ncbi:MAG: hypothetical protein ACTSP3_03780 [Candidatus Heimdallarchaeaceae archaeon]
MNEEYILLKNIEKFGEKYCENYLQYNIEELETNWWTALKFVFARSFMRGRSDKLSNEYYTYAIQILEEQFKIGKEDNEKSFELLLKFYKRGLFDKDLILNFKKKYNLGRKNSVKNDKFTEEVKKKNRIVQALTTKREITIEWDTKVYRKEIYLGYDEDIMMVLDVLKYLAMKEKRYNLYSYIKNGISKDIEKIYSELLELRAIKYKITSLILRDIILLNIEELDIRKEFLEMIFPIDTWVEKIFEILDKSSDDIELIVMRYIDKCLKYKIHPALFAAGLWYIGYNSLNITLNYFLRNYEIDDKKL